MFAQTGERISDYEVLKLLGRGSFGVVLLGGTLPSMSRCFSPQQCDSSFYV